MTYGSHSHSLVHTGNTWADWQYVTQPHTNGVVSQQFVLTNPVSPQGAPKEPEMTVAQQIAKERQEAHERIVLEARWDGLEATLPIEMEVAVIRFTATYKGKAYTYAAVWADDHWYCTGIGAPQRVALHPFIQWLIEREVEPEDVEVWS